LIVKDFDHKIFYSSALISYPAFNTTPLPQLHLHSSLFIVQFGLSRFALLQTFGFPHLHFNGTYSIIFSFSI
jgi:hypothetical protein